MRLFQTGPGQASTIRRDFRLFGFVFYMCFSEKVKTSIRAGFNVPESNRPIGSNWPPFVSRALVIVELLTWQRLTALRMHVPTLERGRALV